MTAPLTLYIALGFGERITGLDGVRYSYKDISSNGKTLTYAEFLAWLDRHVNGELQLSMGLYDDDEQERTSS